MVVCLGLYTINQTMVDAVQYYEYNKQYTTKKGVTVDYIQRVPKPISSKPVGRPHAEYSADDIATLKFVYNRLGTVNGTCKWVAFDGFEISPYCLRSLIKSDKW